MTFEEALAELGIAADAAPEQARRAYLRLLKTRKPETDPQGFMRLREAYDLIKPRLEWRDAFLRARVVAEASAPEPAATPEPAVEETPEEPARAIRDEDAPPEPPVEARREEAPPEEAPSEEAGPEEAAPEEARREQAPPRRPQRNAAQRERAQPEEAPHEEEQHEGGQQEPPPDPAHIHALLTAGHHEEAAGELARLFDLAVERSLDAAPFVSNALRLMLMLFAQNSAPAAADLGASLFDYLRASGQEARAVRGADAARWTILRELAALSPSFSDKIRSAIARAALAGDLSAATKELTKLQARRPGPAAEAAMALRRRAPVIAAAVADVLDPPAPPAPRAAPSSSSGRGGWAFAAVAIGLVRVLMMLARVDSSPSTYTPPTYQPSRYTPSYDPSPIAAILDGGMAPLTLTPLDDIKQRALSKVDRVQAHVARSPATDAGRRVEGYDAMSKHAADVEDALERADCVAARAHTRALLALFAAAGVLHGDEAGRLASSALQQAVGAYCDALDASRRPGARR